MEQEKEQKTKRIKEAIKKIQALAKETIDNLRELKSEEAE